MAYAILKHESMWSATDRAIVQQWFKGRRGRRNIMQVIEEILDSQEVVDFMEGLDIEPLYADTVSSAGVWAMLARVLCCALPARRIRCARSCKRSGSRRIPDVYNVL